MFDRFFTQSEPQLLLPAPQIDEHKHQYELVTKTYAPPTTKYPQTENIQILQNAMFGLTTHLFQCIVCKDFKKEAMPGSDNPQLDDLMEKADVYGPQYIQKDDKTYVVMRYVPQPTTVPLR